MHKHWSREAVARRFPQNWYLNNALNTAYFKKVESAIALNIWMMGDFHVTTILLHVIASLSGGNECTSYGHTQSDQTSTVWVNGKNFDLINICWQTVPYCWLVNCGFGRYFIWNRTVLPSKWKEMQCFVIIKLSAYFVKERIIFQFIHNVQLYVGCVHKRDWDYDLDIN